MVHAADESKVVVQGLDGYIVAGKDCSGHVGIAHTRWATHGEPSATNAHPHVSMSSVSGGWSDCRHQGR